MTDTINIPRDVLQQIYHVLYKGQTPSADLYVRLRALLDAPRVESAKLRENVELPERFPAGYIAQSEYFVQYDEALRYGDARALAARDADRADAERYRWIKSEDGDPESTLLIGMYDESGFIVPWADDLDAAIDAAMKRGEA